MQNRVDRVAVAVVGLAVEVGNVKTHIPQRCQILRVYMRWIVGCSREMKMVTFMNGLHDDEVRSHERVAVVGMS